jgi:hypothetical protein
MAESSALTEAENQIFDRYRKVHPGMPILPDGAPHPLTYLRRGNFRIVFLLKEGNDPNGAWVRDGGDLRDMARWGGRYPTWHNLATWIAIAQKLPVTEGDRRSQEWRASQLRKAAFVNAKKIPGGSISSTTEITKFAMNPNNKLLLKEQLELYKPHLTLACGNGLFSLLKQIFEGHPEKPGGSAYRGHYGYWFFKSHSIGTVIDFYHPETRQRGGWTELGAMVEENLRYHFPKRYS